MKSKKRDRENIRRPPAALSCQCDRLAAVRAQIAAMERFIEPLDLVEPSSEIAALILSLTPPVIC